MMHFTSKLKSLLVVALCLVGMGASAQSITVDGAAVEVAATIQSVVPVVEKTPYSGDTGTFSVEQVTEALGISSITEATQYIVNVTTNEAVANTTDGWRDANGDAAGWGSSEGMVCVKIQDAASGSIDYVGAIDDTHLAGENYIALWGFVANEKAVLVKVRVKFTGESTISTIKVNGEEVPVAALQIVNHSEQAYTDYSGTTEPYYSADVLEALGVESFEGVQQYILNATTLEAVENTSDGWRNSQGDLAGWGTESKMVCVKIQDPASDLVDYIGCIDSSWKSGEEYDAYFAFVANGKAAIVKIHINFYSTIAPVETDMSKIEVVGNYNVSIERQIGWGYNTRSVELSLPELATALDMPKADLEANLSKLVYVQGLDSIDCQGNELQLLTLTDGWMGQAVQNIDGMAGDPIEGKIIGMKYGKALVFIHDVTYDAETDSVTFVVGHMSSAVSVGQSYTGTLYIMNGSKAFALAVTTAIIADEHQSIDGMTQVGKLDINFDMNVLGGYQTIGFTIDIEKAAELLECSTSDIMVRAKSGEDGLAVDYTTSENGWWFKSGYVATWASHNSGDKMFFINPVEDTPGAYTIGQYPGDYAVGDSIACDLLLTNATGDKYVLAHILVDIVEKESGNDWESWTQVAVRNYTIQSLANGGYEWSSQYVQLTADELTNLIGTSTPTLYALVNPETLADGACPYTDEYSMGEKPGFWLTAEGYQTTWGNNAPWGITCQASTTGVTNGIGFKAIQMEGDGVVGNVFSGKFLLVNLETGQYISILLTNTVVEEVVDDKKVGEINLVAPLMGSDVETTFSLDDIAAALELADIAATDCLTGTLGMAPVQPSTGLQYDLNGNPVDEEGVISFYFEMGALFTTNSEDVAEDYQISVPVYFINNETGAYYVINLTLMSEALYTRISGVAADKASSVIYDLSGRQVSKAQKGIYIQNGKKVLK